MGDKRDSQVTHLAELFFGALIPTVVLLWRSIRRVHSVFSLSQLLLFKMIVLFEGIVVIMMIISIWQFMLSDPKQFETNPKILGVKRGVMSSTMGAFGVIVATIVILARHYYPLTWNAVIDADYDLFFIVLFIPIVLRRRYFWKEEELIKSMGIKKYNRFKKGMILATICAILGFLVSVIPIKFR